MIWELITTLFQPMTIIGFKIPTFFIVYGAGSLFLITYCYQLRDGCYYD